MSRHHVLIEVLRKGLRVVPCLLLPLACVPEGEGQFSLEEEVQDPDNDGVVAPDDCNEGDAQILPGAPEDPEVDGEGDGLDNDCDGLVDEGTIDYDADADGFTGRAGDCDDTNYLIHPGQSDGCDSLDNDCDGLLDEDASDVYEPNNAPIEAYEVGPDGELTCEAWTVMVNLITTDANEGQLDEDWFTFDMGDGGGIGCPFGVTATLQDVPEGTRIELSIYGPDDAGDLQESLSFTSTSGETGGVVRYAPNNADPGRYWVHVAAQAPSAFCQDGMRLVMQGLAAPEIELPAARAARSLP